MAITYLSGQRIQGLGASPSTLSPIIDGSYTILKYTEDGAFTPTGTYDVEYLVVGGGGGGGATDGGAGGGGAFRTDTGNEVTAQEYTITVGAGGTAGAGSQAGTSGGKGGNTIFGSIQSDGGGGGAHLTAHGGDSAGSTGGSGGGTAGGYYSTDAGVSGDFGNDGGDSPSSAGWSGAGGGGSGGAGSGGSGNYQGGNGGTGTNSSITGSAVGYSGGGGGASDGSGGSASHGGGAGMATDNSGTPNTGGGAGAGGSGDSKVGGSGIVVVKFLTSGNGYSATMGSVADRLSVTDVPAGSEFEQTDDYKSYQRSGLPVSLDDLKAYYSCDETTGDVINRASTIGSTDAISSFDLSPIAGSGTVTQGVTGLIDKAISFTGNASAQADDSNLADTAFLSNTGAIWTICLWVKMDNRVGDQAWLATTDLGVGQNGIYFRMQSASGTVYCKFGTQGDVKGGTTSTQVIPDATDWHFIVAQYDYQVGTTNISVDNGTLEAVATGETLDTTTTPQAKLHLGNVPALDNDLNGDVDEVSIWNRILTTAELTKIYNAGSGKLLGSGSWVERGTAL